MKKSILNKNLFPFVLTYFEMHFNAYPDYINNKIYLKWEAFAVLNN